MYTLTLVLHSWLRWAVILAGIVAVGRGLAGWLRGQRWTRADETVGGIFVATLDLQFLIGLLLYFALSPATAEALRDFGGAMGNSGLRFWAVEHPFGMLLGLALAHIGRVRSRKAPEGPPRHRTAAIFYGLALILILVSIPWPGGPQGRPLLRW